MSAALVRKSLSLVDDTFEKISAPKIDVSKQKKRLTVTDVRKTNKTKQQIIKENKAKLKLIREACAIELDEDITSQLIERAVTRRPVKPKKKVKKTEETAFTEEDFKKFEEEYFDDGV